MKPLFLFSLPRSGSTLLQRILATSDCIATASEPWFLLPSLYALREKGCAAEYGHRTLVHAVEDFCELFPGGQNEYREKVADMARDLYGRAAGRDVEYFLDKTPRYHLIIDDIMRMFPDGRFILLWRNPLAVAASMMQTWNRGKWNLHHFHVDLYTGFETLARVHEQYADRLIVVRFENLVSQPQKECERLCDELNIRASAKMWQGFAERQLAGRMGDPTGTVDFDRIEEKTIRKWRSAFCNPLRREWGRRYLRFLGAERLAMLGYDAGQLRAELAEEGGYHRLLGSDCLRMSFGTVRRNAAAWLFNRPWL